jgi:hypothetical protein
MYKDREVSYRISHIAYRKAYIADCEIESDKDFNKTLSRFMCIFGMIGLSSLSSLRMQRDVPYVTLPRTAGNGNLGFALRQTYIYLLNEVS